FIVAVFAIAANSLNAQNYYDSSGDLINEVQDKDSINNIFIYEVGYTFSPYSFNQTRLIFDASNYIFEDIDEVIAARTANLHSFFLGTKGYLGASRKTVVYFGANLHTSQQLNFLNVEISAGRSWMLTPFDNQYFRFNTQLGINLNTVGYNLENNPNDAGISQRNLSAISSIELQIPIYKKLCFFVRGTAALPFYTWKQISFPIEETTEGTRFQAFNPKDNADILTIEPNGNRLFNSFFFFTTGISFSFK
ncbi:MAG: hypothetical protein EA358_10085, partial [Flavobacteriales bacterium]